MREIHFRGKNLKGIWVFGFYVNCGLYQDLIHEGGYGDIWTVAPETVGQYTGLKDKNGAEIYEGDILRHEYSKRGIDVEPFIVVWEDRIYNNGWAWKNIYDNQQSSLSQAITYSCKLIGNIHDNPELLKIGSV